MKNRAIFKFNNGNLALLCNRCRTILKEGSEFTKCEMKACKGLKPLPRQYCQTCKNEMIKGQQVSFDFDSTLDREDVQEFAKELIELGVEVWIITSRFQENDTTRINWNDDLFLVADKLGIDRNHIIFTEMLDKHVFINKMNLTWHLDDDSMELKNIGRFTKTKGISVFGNSTWKNKCLKYLINGRLL